MDTANNNGDAAGAANGNAASATTSSPSPAASSSLASLAANTTTTTTTTTSSSSSPTSPATTTTSSTGAELIIRSLINHGVDVVFGYPGGSVLDIYDELYKHSDQIKHVLTAHEQGAAHAADGYARATGRVGVVIATSGPGATNLVTGIATAYLDSVPLVAITGNVATPLLGKDSFQEVDIIGITIPVTKHSFIIRNVNELPGVLAEAFMIAASGRPGPVLIDIPKDVQAATTRLAPAEPLPLPAASLSPTPELTAAAKLIKAAERPYIYCGGGVVTAAAGEQLLQFAEQIDAVIGCSMMGLSAIPASHPRNLGMTGMHGHEASILAKSRADLVIAVGVRFSDRATGNKAAYTKDTRFIHIDIDPAEIGKNISVDQALLGDIKAILQALTNTLDDVRRSDWHQEVEAMRECELARVRDDQQLRADQLIAAVRARTTDDTVVATDVGQHQMWVAQHYGFERPRRFLTSGGLGTMGFGLGAAIGGCLGVAAAGRAGEPHAVQKYTKTVLFTGDGSFSMNLQELATAVSQQLPIVVVIFNNNALGMVRQWQALFYEQRYSATTLGRKTDFVALARAFGADGQRVDSLQQLEPALDAAFAASGPFVVDCVIDSDEWVVPMIPPGKAVDDMLTSAPALDSPSPDGLPLGAT
jgi:acetolactate synthase-1/2/3 large subunit